MSNVQINDDITVQDFYEHKLPQLFAQQLEQDTPSNLEGEEFRINYNVEHTTYGISIKNGTQMEIVQGGVLEPHLSVTMNEADWRDAMTGKVLVQNPVALYNTRKHLDKIKNFKGIFRVRLTKEDGSEFNSHTVFNGVENPEVTIIAKASDYALVQQGKMNPQMAMMTGKVKFEGSLPFLMTLGSLNQ